MVRQLPLILTGRLLESIFDAIRSRLPDHLIVSLRATNELQRREGVDTPAGLHVTDIIR